VNVSAAAITTKCPSCQTKLRVTIPPQLGDDEEVEAAAAVPDGVAVEATAAEEGLAAAAVQPSASSGGGPMAVEAAAAEEVPDGVAVEEAAAAEEGGGGPMAVEAAAAEEAAVDATEEAPVQAADEVDVEAAVQAEVEEAAVEEEVEAVVEEDGEENGEDDEQVVAVEATDGEAVEDEEEVVDGEAADGGVVEADDDGTKTQKSHLADAKYKDIASITGIGKSGATLIMKYMSEHPNDITWASLAQCQGFGKAKIDKLRGMFMLDEDISDDMLNASAPAASTNLLQQLDDGDTLAKSSEKQAKNKETSNPDADAGGAPAQVKRPRGAAPKNKKWDTTKGVWVDALVDDNEEEVRHDVGRQPLHRTLFTSPSPQRGRGCKRVNHDKGNAGRSTRGRPA
jgi:DNA uptake protein ComE-like DNA-binding protein